MVRGVAYIRSLPGPRPILRRDIYIYQADSTQPTTYTAQLYNHVCHAQTTDVRRSHVRCHCSTRSTTTLSLIRRHAEEGTQQDPTGTLQVPTTSPNLAGTHPPRLTARSVESIRLARQRFDVGKRRRTRPYRAHGSSRSRDHQRVRGTGRPCQAGLRGRTPLDEITGRAGRGEDEVFFPRLVRRRRGRSRRHHREGTSKQTKDLEQTLLSCASDTELLIACAPVLHRGQVGSGTSGTVWRRVYTTVKSVGVPDVKF